MSATAVVSRAPVPWRFVLSVWLSTRLLVLAAGTAALVLGGADPYEATHNLRWAGPRPTVPWLEMWLRYDAEWYLTIATSGYGPLATPYYDMRPNFFPLYPAILGAAVRAGLPPVVTGLAISNACFIGFLALLYRFAAPTVGDAAARRALWLYGLFPTSFYLSGIYTESMLLAAVAGAFVALRRARPGMAGGAAAAAVLTRAVGVLTVPALLVEWWTRRHARIRESQARTARTDVIDLWQLCLPAALAAAGYLVFAAYTFGHPFAADETQTLYRGALRWPWLAFAPLLTDGGEWFGYANSWLDAGLAALFLVLVPAAFRALGPASGVLAATMVVFPLATGLVSFSRMVLPAFPCMIVLALWSERRPVRWVLFASSAALLVWLTARFATWHWVA